jgi:hypothetical protein
MARKLWTGIGALTVAAFAYVASASPAKSSGVQWDKQASDELAVALHQLHEVWNTGDIKSLKNAIVGDDALVTFELDPATHRPIRLASKKDLDAFVDNVASDLDTSKAVQELDHPVVNCRGTGNFGICTEECTVRTKLPGNEERVYRLWSTATAVKQDGTWKWIQWHMSLAAPTQVFKDGKLVTASNSLPGAE